MSRWFRFYDDAINHPKLLRLSDEYYRAWSVLLCVASQNGGTLPPTEDIALTLRLKPAKVAEWITTLVKGGLFDETEAGFAPHNWASRQYKSDVTDPTAPLRQKAYRDRIKNRNATVTATDTRLRLQNRTDSEAVTALVEVSDEAALAAWDAYGRQTNGKAYPRNRRGGWHFPSRWPPGHVLKEFAR